jgi:hypothetical protein
MTRMPNRNAFFLRPGGCPDRSRCAAATLVPSQRSPSAASSDSAKATSRRPCASAGQRRKSGGYGGAALSLRETALDRTLLVEVVRCGRPATRMPYHDRSAYQATDCYGGTTKADLGADFPPKAATFLRDEEIEAVADYVIARQQGKGAPSRDDCVAFWGANSHECAAIK